MKIVPNFKTIGLAGVMALTLGMGFSCQNKKTEQKPMYNVTLTQPCDRWFVKGNQTSFPVKFEEGCSYESENKKYIMCNGQLYSIDKRDNKIQKEDTIKVSDHEAEIFKQVACYNSSASDTMELSKNNIQKSLLKQENLREEESNNLNWRPAAKLKEIENGFKAQIHTIPYYTNVFRYNDTIN